MSVRVRVFVDRDCEPDLIPINTVLGSCELQTQTHVILTANHTHSRNYRLCCSFDFEERNMSRHTPWTHKASSLPSDRIPSRNATPKPVKASPNRTAAGSPQPTTAPKSKDVRRLEILVKGLQSLVTSGAQPPLDPKGGCFCQGQCQVNPCTIVFFTLLA